MDLSNNFRFENFYKNTPNLLSILRIILSFFLFLTVPLSLNFFIIYLIVAATDILDGYLARNFYGVSDFGAKLDSFADAIFFLSFLIVIYPILNIDYLIFIWILAIFLIKLASISIGFIKYKKFTLVHTYLNKLTGGALILLPLWLLFIPSDIVLILLCLIATIAAIEELVIIIFIKNPDLNLKSIFLKS